MAFGPKVSEVSKTTSVVGGYLVFAGLISYYFKENLYIPDAVPSTIVGVIFGPLCANLVNPSEWFDNDQHTLLNFTLHLSRIIIGIQVFFNGANLPKKYIKTEWLSLSMILFPIMTFGWLLIGLLVWGLIPDLSFLECLVIAACIVPTDPVLANSICKGRFAETFVPLGVRALLIGESGANDGLALPYLMLSIYLVRRSDPSNEWSSLGAAIGHWMYEIIIYQVILGAVMGILIGIAVRKTLRWAHDRHFVDHESFLAYGVATSLFILGVVHLTGASDFIACFLAGCMINWDGWYQEECAGQAFSEIVDMYLATAIFLYIGALLPFDYWHADTNIVDGWRLFVLGVLVLLLRRLPFIIPMTRLMPCLDGWKEAAFVGYFGPIGVGTLYWTSEALEYLPETPNREHLREVILPINYFLIVFSVLIHGTSISFFQATRSAVGKGHPEPKEDDPIPIRPGAGLYISPSHLHSRNDLSISRTTTRRQSAREYLSSHIALPSAGASRPNAYRSQLDLALERSNSRRTSARDYLERARTISPEDYDAALRRDDSNEDDPKANQLSMTARARSSPTPARRRSSNSVTTPDPVGSTASNPPAQHIRANSGDSSSGNNGNNRLSRLDWIRRGRLARGEPISDDDDNADTDSATVAAQITGDASDRV